MDYLGDPAATPDVQRYSIDALKNIRGYTNLTTYWNQDPQAYMFGGSYFNHHRDICPWLWNYPTNELDNGGEFTRVSREVSRSRLQGGDYTTYRIGWHGRAIVFHNPEIYLNGLQLITDPLEYIRYLRLAQLAGFRFANYGTYFGPQLPADAIDLWWKEVLSFYLFDASFDILRTAQIEHLTDLQYVYNATADIIPELKAELYGTDTVTVTPHTPDELSPIAPYRDDSISFRLQLELPSWIAKSMSKIIDDMSALVENPRERAAARIIELSDPDATIQPTAFSTDIYQNPYLVFDTTESERQARPVFRNVAQNQSATFSPDLVVGDPSDMQYWIQVAQFEQDRARVYNTPLGPMSVADLRQYGLDRKTNYLPWIAAGVAVAVAASEVI